MKQGTRNRGFASMDSEKQKEIARKGGKAAHEKGTAHEFTPDEARQAGRKGGERVSVDRARMAAIGRRGGITSAARRQAARKPAPGETAPEMTTQPHMEQEELPQNQPGHTPEVHESHEASPPGHEAHH